MRVFLVFPAVFPGYETASPAAAATFHASSQAALSSANSAEPELALKSPMSMEGTCMSKLQGGNKLPWLRRLLPHLKRGVHRQEQQPFGQPNARQEPDSMESASQVEPAPCCPHWKYRRQCQPLLSHEAHPT